MIPRTAAIWTAADEAAYKKAEKCIDDAIRRSTGPVITTWLPVETTRRVADRIVQAYLEGGWAVCVEDSVDQREPGLFIRLS